MNELRDRLDGILSKLAEIEGPAGVAPGSEKELCQQMRSLAEAVEEMLARLETVEERVIPKVPPAIPLGPPSSFR